MTNDNKIKTETLRDEIKVRAGVFAEKLVDCLGANLKSVTITGSSLTDDFSPGKSDINSVLVLTTQNLETLKTMASMSRWMRKNGIATPLLMTEKYVERSRDVFGVEFLDIQLIHDTIFGDDLFSELEFGKSDVRLQCERELKAMLIRLRQGYVAAAGKKRLVRDILISTSAGIVGVLRAMLWLKDQERPTSTKMVFQKAQNIFYITKAAVEFSVETDKLIEANEWKYKKKRLNEEEMIAAYESIYKAVDQLSVIVDNMQV